MGLFGRNKTVFVLLHFGLLPRYGGCYPVAWSILNGEAEAGVTMHVMVEAFDQGDILAQQSVPIHSSMTARDLFDALSASLLLAAITGIDCRSLHVHRYLSFLENRFTSPSSPTAFVPPSHAARTAALLKLPVGLDKVRATDLDRVNLPPLNSSEHDMG